MGLQIRIPGTSFTHYGDRIAYPIQDSLTSLYVLGGDAAASVKNHAPATSGDGSVVGSLTYEDYYAIFTGDSTDNYIQLLEKDDVADTTEIAVFRMPNAVAGTPAGRQIFSVWGHSNGGFNLHHDAMLSLTAGSSLLRYFTGAAGAFSQSNFYFRAGIASGNDVNAYSVQNGVVKLGQTGSLVRNLDATGAYRLGGSYFASPGYLDTADIAMVSKHNAALTLNDLQEIYEFVKAYYARRGLTVL